MTVARVTQPGNDQCPVYRRWTAQSDTPERWRWLEPFSWQGGYVVCYDGRGAENWSLLAYDEFWDWADRTNAVCAQAAKELKS